MATPSDEGRIGQRITDARESNTMTQGELASEVGLERSAVNKIEKGVRRVTAFELSEIARALGRPMDWFLSEPPSAIVSRRQREGTSSKSIDIWIERLAREIEFVQSLSDRLPLVTPEPYPSPAGPSDAEDLAARARTELSYSADEPINDLVSACESVGLLVFSHELGADAADGATVLLTHGGVAIINSSNEVGRRRLTLAHEIGHYLLADEYSVDSTVLMSYDESREALIDRFGRAFLVPQDALETFWKQASANHSDLRVQALLAASHFRVDFATLARRLQDLGLATAEEASAVRSARAGRADYVEYNLHVPIDLGGTTIPRAYELAVIALYKGEKLSPERTLDLTFDLYNESDLPERGLRSETETWQFI